MKNKYIHRPTTFLVLEWNEEGSKLLNQEAYPIHLYSFDDVIKSLEGKEDRCDIYESRFSKKRNKYITVGNTYEWDGYKWVS